LLIPDWSKQMVVVQKMRLVGLALLIGILSGGAYLLMNHSSEPRQVPTGNITPSAASSEHSVLLVIHDCWKGHDRAEMSACVAARGGEAQANKALPPGSRIDMPVTDATGVRLDFGDAVLRVPQFMVESRLWPSDRREALKVQRFVFTFWYPAMELSNLWGPKSPPPGSRLLIYVSNLVYSPDGSPRNRDPRPSDILANNLDEIGPPEISPSPYPGLRSASYLAASLKKFPGLRNHLPAPSSTSHLYIQTIDSPYELHVYCGVDITGSCTANMYSKTHHFSMQVRP
jgi:hypothetical protein